MEGGSGGGQGESSCCPAYSDACHERGSSVNWCCLGDKNICDHGSSSCVECTEDDQCASEGTGPDGLSFPNCDANMCDVSSCYQNGGASVCSPTLWNHSYHCQNCGAATYCKLANVNSTVGICSLPPTSLPNIKPTTTQVAMLLSEKLILEILNPFRGKKPIPVPTLIKIKNPFGATLNITSIHFSVIIKTSSKNQLNQTRDVVVGTASHSNVNIVVPRYNSTWIPPILLSVDLSQEFDVITGFIIDMEEKGSQNVSLIGNFSFITGGLLFNPKNYRQNDNIPCCIQDPKSERHDCP